MELEQISSGKVLGLTSIELSDDSIELNPFCFYEEVQSNNLINKLFQFVIEWAKINKINKIFSYTDNRWRDEDNCKKLGFILETEFAPEYKFADIKNKLRLDTNSGDFPRIWDCGKKRWIFNI